MNRSDVRGTVRFTIMGFLDDQERDFAEVDEIMENLNEDEVEKLTDEAFTILRGVTERSPNAAPDQIEEIGMKAFTDSLRERLAQPGMLAKLQRGESS